MMTPLYKTKLYLNASECNAQRQISLPLLIQRLIETATEHTDLLGVGYSHLSEQSKTWVLSRLSLSMDKFPSINTYYNIESWISMINRHFVERCFAISDDNGNPLGYARTVWIAINLETRRGGDMTEIMSLAPILDRACPVSSGTKIQPVKAPESISTHTFGYCDIDFNRHVNSTRYIETLLNTRQVEFYDQHAIKHFDIAYMDEIHYNDRVTIYTATTGENTTTYEISREGTPVTRARITFN